MKKTIFAAAMALCLMVGTSASAQNTESARMPKERPTPEKMAQMRTDRMAEKLNLNEQQKQQIYEINLEETKDMQNRSEQMRVDRKAQAEKLKSILTPEQYAQWQQSLKDRKQMGHGPQMRDGKMSQDKSCGDCDKKENKPGDKKGVKERKERM